MENNRNTINSNDDSLFSIAFAFMIVSCVIGAFLWFIPLFWCIPMTIIYRNKHNKGEEISTAFKVCTLIFVSLVAGILMLCDNNQTNSNYNEGNDVDVDSLVKAKKLFDEGVITEEEFEQIKKKTLSNL